jgi:hypothetical protein
MELNSRMIGSIFLATPFGKTRFKGGWMNRSTFQKQIKITLTFNGRLKNKTD